MKIVNNDSRRSYCCNAMTYRVNNSNVVKCCKCKQPQINN